MQAQPTLMIEAALAERLGIQPESRMEFDIVGGFVELPLGTAVFEIEGRSFRVPVVLGDTNLIGLTTLETLQLTVDPIAGRLVSRRGILFPVPVAAST